MRKTDGRCGCGALKAKIDGRTLRDALKRTEVDNNFGKFSDTEWVDVCPKCNADTLYRKFPFLCHDGVMRTTENLDPNTNLYKSNDLSFAGFTFSKLALYSSIRATSMRKPFRLTDESMDAKTIRKKTAYGQKMLRNWARPLQEISMPTLLSSLVMLFAIGEEVKEFGKISKKISN